MQNWHWRNSMRPVRFFSFDARAAIPYVFLLLYARLITLIICIVVTIIFALLERRGLTVPSAMRKFRSWLVGPKRPAWITIRRRRMVDYK
ncbi:MAG: type IV secretion protein IcmT [Rhodospirillales bacterium]|nr:type IV secretion protein IcmT [Rhodospirillales bacterium]MCB9965574.1 type IV secretion protein IcmT [Rhodospirillales bacterium]MCB9979815.1 type IV secretion protein IcmT [Rhodospirillales bacterium]